jgi:DNA polymerase I-like protein with 3'-5' exonuclease and polymerase domains
MKLLLEQIFESSVIGLDTETTGVQYPRDAAFSVGIATEWDKFYLDFREDHGLAKQVAKVIHDARPVIAAHNASFDAKMMASAGYPLPLDLFQCTMVRACLIDEHEHTPFPWKKQRGSYSLDYQARKHLGMNKTDDFEDRAKAALGLPANYARGKLMGRIADVPREIVEVYAKDDAELARLLWWWQEAEIKRQDIRQIVEFEQKLFPVIVESEMRGIDVDVDIARKAQEKLSVEIEKAQRDLDRDVGREVNVNSSPQMKTLFEPYEVDGQWHAKDGTPLERTKTGNPSLGGEALHNMTDPLAEQIINIRSLIKTRDTFLGSHVIGHEYNGKVYPNINQAKGEDGGTSTGRLSYTDPAMQQIPSRNKTVASIVKPCFKPPEGKVWLETDLASFEVRIFAHLVGAYNDTLVTTYAKNPEMDFHQWVGDMTNLPRNATYSGEPNAKQLNLSMIFNQGKGATAAKMGMDWEWDSFTDKQGNEVRYQKAGLEAQEVIRRYHTRVQGVHQLAERAKLLAEANEQIKTAFGRRLRFPRGYKSYKASGLLIQSTAADVNKRNWLVINEALGSDGHLILNTHDSYSMAVPEDWKKYYKLVKEAIEDMSDIKLRAPLILDLDGAGSDWWSAKCGELK